MEFIESFNKKLEGDEELYEGTLLGPVVKYLFNVDNKGKNQKKRRKKLQKNGKLNKEEEIFP